MRQAWTSPKEESWAEGRAEGRTEGRKAGLAESEAKTLSRLIHSMAKTANPEDISKATELPLAQVLSILNPAPN